MAADGDNIIPLGRRPAKAGSLIEPGGDVDSVCVTMALYGEALDPDGVTRSLGVAPTSSYRRGDPRRGDLPAHRGGGWFLEQVGDAPQTPETLTEALLARLPAATHDVWGSLAEHFDLKLHFALYLYSFNRGFELAPSLAWRIAAMRLRVVFDIYAG